MAWFGKTKKRAGWMAVSLASEGICIAHVQRPAASRPVVELATRYPAAASAVETLEKAARELQASHYQCTTLLAPGEYQLLSVDAPNVPPDELKVAVRWKLKDLLDYRVDDATIDVLDVPGGGSGPARNHSMYAVAARNQTIQQRQTLFGNAKIPLSVIDIPEMAQRNFSALLETEGRGLAFLSFDEQGGLLTVTYDGELYLARRIDLPLSQLEQAGEEQRAACFDRITLELQRSLDHFDRQYHLITIASLMLAPAGQAGPALRAYLSEHLYVPVEMFDLETVLDTAKAPQLRQPDEQQRYFMALGIALRQEEIVL